MSNLRCWVWTGRQCWFGWQRVNLIPASYYTRIVCIVRALCVLYARACYDSTLQRAALWAYTSQLIGHPLLSTWLQFAYIVHFEEILVPRSSISSYESECRTLCSTAEETRGQCSRVENIIPASSRHAPSPLHMSATTATNPLNYDTKWCIMFQP